MPLLRFMNGAEPFITAVYVFEQYERQGSAVHDFKTEPLGHIHHLLLS